MNDNSLILSEKVNALTLLLSWHVIPLFFLNKKGIPTPAGSALLIKHQGKLYLVTAAHVIDAASNGAQLFFYSDSNRLCYLRDEYIETVVPVGATREDDPIDLMIIALSDEESFYLKSHVPFPSEDFEVDPLDKKDRTYLVVGYPCTKTKSDRVKKQITSQVMGFWNSSVSTDEYSQTKFQPHSHILIKFDRKRVIQTDGKQGIAPAPHGLSGCPVFLLWDESKMEDDSANTVVGIIIEHNPRKKYLVGVSSKFVLEMLDRLIKNPPKNDAHKKSIE